jgi:hypothetical protein
MTAKAIRTHGQRTCAVEVSASEVDAGAELTVRAFVSCPHGCDLTGQRVSIRNRDGAELASAALSAFDGEAHVMRALVLRAPLETGEHIYRAVLAADEKDGVAHEETSTAFSFVTMAHAMSVNVWGLPSAIAAGERFALKVGIKCSAGCKLTGGALRIFDHDGAQVGSASLLDDVWPGTTALYFSEVEAHAPLEPGDYAWEVRTPASERGVPHAGGSSRFAVKIVGPADYEVTIAAFDGTTQAPISGAHVLLHPYRTSTDQTGMAKVKVTRGRYQLFVSGFNYIPYAGHIDVAGDVTVRVELAVEPEGQEDYR